MAEAGHVDEDGKPEQRQREVLSPPPARERAPDAGIVPDPEPVADRLDRPVSPAVPAFDERVRRLVPAPAPPDPAPVPEPVAFEVPVEAVPVADPDPLEPVVADDRPPVLDPDAAEPAVVDAEAVSDSESLGSVPLESSSPSSSLFQTSGEGRPLVRFAT